MANVELLERVLTHLKDHPEQHDQTVWYHADECGTAACFAGWACLLSDMECWEEPKVWYAFVRDGTGKVESVRRAAKRLLGLADYEASILFDQNNTIEDLERMVKTLANGQSLLDAE